MWSSLALFGSVEFDKIYAKWNNYFQIKPFLPLYVEARRFIYLTMMFAVRICIQLHGNKLEWDAPPTIRTKRKCYRNVEKGQQDKKQIYTN